MRDHRRGPGHAVGAGPQQAAQDAGTQQGRDRADETKVGENLHQLSHKNNVFFETEPTFLRKRLISHLSHHIYWISRNFTISFDVLAGENLIFYSFSVVTLRL